MTDTFVSSVIPGATINEYNLEIIKGLEGWTKYGHCGYKKCDGKKFDPETGQKLLCENKRGYVLGRDKCFWDSGKDRMICPCGGGTERPGSRTTRGVIDDFVRPADRGQTWRAIG